jgi:hypothetical protein
LSPPISIGSELPIAVPIITASVSMDSSIRAGHAVAGDGAGALITVPIITAAPNRAGQQPGA